MPKAQNAQLKNLEVWNFAFLAWVCWALRRWTCIGNCGVVELTRAMTARSPYGDRYLAPRHTMPVARLDRRDVAAGRVRQAHADVVCLDAGGDRRRAIVRHVAARHDPARF